MAEAAHGEDVIIELSPNEYKTIVHVTKSTIRSLCSDKGARKGRIQSETNTKITWTRIKSDGGASKRIVEITGATHQEVYAARKQIKFNDGATNKQKRPTHFTCVHITDATVKENFLKLKQAVLSDERSKGLSEAIFTRPEKLHITFDVMHLNIDENYQPAIQLFNECLATIINPIKSEFDKCDVKVRGVKIMKGTPENARVVYAEIQSDALQKIADSITDVFIQSGFADRSEQNAQIKLHMTLMNAKSKRPIRPFDVSHILEQYADFDFGAQQINQIILASMIKRDSDGFYERIARIFF